MCYYIVVAPHSGQIRVERFEAMNMNILYIYGAMAAYALIFGLALAAISLKYDRDPSDHTS